MQHKRRNRRYASSSQKRVKVIRPVFCVYTVNRMRMQCWQFFLLLSFKTWTASREKQIPIQSVESKSKISVKFLKEASEREKSAAHYSFHTGIYAIIANLNEPIYKRMNHCVKFKPLRSNLVISQYRVSQIVAQSLVFWFAVYEVSVFSFSFIYFNATAYVSNLICDQRMSHI